MSLITLQHGHSLPCTFCPALISLIVIPPHGHSLSHIFILPHLPALMSLIMWSSKMVMRSYTSAPLSPLGKR